MSIEAKEVRLGELLTEVKGFYIPNFQRPYTWTVNDVNRLFETIKKSLIKFIDSNGEYYAFLGGILAIQDTGELESKYKISRDNSPSHVYALIDGQQRITSLILLTAEIYKKLLNIEKEIKNLNLELDADYRGLLNLAINECEKSLFVNNDLLRPSDTDPNLDKFLPKIIYGENRDEWKKKEAGKYYSPISKYLQELSNNPETKINSKEIFKITEKMKDLIDSFINDDDKHNLLDKILKKNGNLKKLLYSEISEKILKNLKDPERKKLFKEFIFLLILNKYIRDYIFFARIVVKKQSLAFDIFDSLNSTGDLLTAFETFRPIVISHLGDKYHDSIEESYLNHFTEYISEFPKLDRHKRTKEFIISLALFETGASLGYSLNEQREYLQEETFDKYSNKDKTELCHSISLLTDFYEDIWNEKDINRLSGYFSTESKLGLAILKDTDHTITIPVLARYYSELIIVDPDNEQNYKDFAKVIKSIVTFSLFWRLLHSGGTGGIEDKYRELLKEHLCRKADKNLKHFDLNKKLQEYLNEKLTSSKSKHRNNFISNVSGSLYSQTGKNRWLKFFMLAALHDTIPDGTSGLDKKSTNDKMPTLKYEVWKSIEPLTIEHIAPQEHDDNSKWDPILLNPKNVDSIGNLTLLPKISNSIVSNREWEEKKKLYNILSLGDPQLRLAQIEKMGSFNAKTRAYLHSANCWPTVASLAKCELDWTPELIQKRAERLAELAWDNLSPWLGY